MSSIYEQLSLLFRCEHRQGWVALKMKGDIDLSTFKTERLAKLMPNGELQFTIGATLIGQSVNLNRTIQMIIAAEGLEVLMRETTSGSRGYEAPYPTISAPDVQDGSIARIVHRVEGAVLKVIADASRDSDAA